MPDPETTRPPPPDPQAASSGGGWREERRRERHARRAARWGGDGSGSGWAGPSLGGLVLVLLGIGLLLQHLGYQLPERWWALLLLLPAVGALVGAIRAYRAEGMNGNIVAELVSGAIFTVLALALFFGLDWGLFWPAVLVVLGLGLLIRGYWPR